MFSEITDRLRVFICSLTAVLLFYHGFQMIAERESEKLLRENFDFLQKAEFQVKALNFFRSDFLVQHKGLKWTFNRLTGELIPWGFKEWKIQSNSQ